MTLPVRDIMVRSSARFCSAVALCGVAALGHADGLRGIEVGESCHKAAVIEPGLGSNLVGTGAGASFLHFTGRYSGEQADIIYICDGGQLAEQVITIGTANREHAFRLADEIRLATVKELGAPAHDGLGLNYLQKLWYSLWGVSGDVMLQSSIWNVDNRETFLWVTPGSNNRWDVRYSQSAPATMIVNEYVGVN